MAWNQKPGSSDPDKPLLCESSLETINLSRRECLKQCPSEQTRRFVDTPKSLTPLSPDAEGWPCGFLLEISEPFSLSGL